MSSPWNFVADQAAAFSDTVTWRDSDGDLVDLSGYDSAQMDIREGPTVDDALLLTLTTGNGRVTLGGAAGTIDLAVEAADMDVDPGTYYHELWLVSSGEPESILKGTFTVTAARNT